MRGRLRALRIRLAELIAPAGSALFVPATDEESAAFFDVLDRLVVEDQEEGPCGDPNCLCAPIPVDGATSAFEDANG